MEQLNLQPMPYSSLHQDENSGDLSGGKSYGKPTQTSRLPRLLLIICFTLNLLLAFLLIKSHRTVIPKAPVELVELSTDLPANDLVILFAYFETTASRVNAEFFIRHALHDNADFVFILSGETDLDKLLPIGAKNIKVIRKYNECYDMGSYGMVLNANDGAVAKKYKRFIMLNDSIRGPFVPHWSDSCWSDAYMNRITEKVKLVGMSFNCNPSRHVQSMILATDNIGIDILRSPKLLGSCESSYQGAVNIETSTTQYILDAGYEVDVMLAAFQADPTYSRTCTQDDMLFEGRYYGISVTSYETMFHKTSSVRAITPLALERLTDWTLKMHYSSYGVCHESALARNRRRIEAAKDAKKLATITSTAQRQ